MPASDARWMALALSLGRRAMGTTWPNPAVGCVIVRKDRVLGRGITAPGGRPHAETAALAMAGRSAEGATAYVTLEPCAHHGKTPPCAEALVRAGVARVVTAIGDPDPRVAGKGHQILQNAGIEVTSGCLRQEAARDHAGFLSRTTQGRPFVTLKMATSLDGRIATASGESRWITDAPARRRVHLMRARHDAVLIGIGTVLADDPSLTIRDLGMSRSPVRVVLDTHLSIPLASNLVKTARSVPLWLCHGPGVDAKQQAALKAAGVHLLPLPLSGAHVDPVAAMKSLADQGLTRIFCEGGGRLAAALLGADLVDVFVGFTAGLALGATGLPALGPLGIERLAQHPRFTLVETSRLDNDVLTVWKRG